MEIELRTNVRTIFQILTNEYFIYYMEVVLTFLCLKLWKPQTSHQDLVVYLVGQHVIQRIHVLRSSMTSMQVNSDPTKWQLIYTFHPHLNLHFQNSEVGPSIGRRKTGNEIPSLAVNRTSFRGGGLELSEFAFGS